MTRVLVSGGVGFVGSHLVEALLETDVEVLVLDNFSTGRLEHLNGRRNDPKLSLTVGDIRSAEDLRVIREFAPDVVLHMAAVHFIPYCEANPRETMEVNVGGLVSLLRSLRGLPLRSFVFASSGAVYGFGPKPWLESDQGRPDDVYSLSKWVGEDIMRLFHEDRPDTRIVVTRLFNAYGPRETNPHVVPAIVGALGEGVTIELGNLWPKRDLIHVADAASGILAALPGKPGFDVVNVGTGHAQTIECVLDTISGILGRPLDVRQVRERMRPKEGHLVSNPRKLMSTGWAPGFDLESGLRDLLKYEGLL